MGMPMGNDRGATLESPDFAKEFTQAVKKLVEQSGPGPIKIEVPYLRTSAELASAAEAFNRLLIESAAERAGLADIQTEGAYTHTQLTRSLDASGFESTSGWLNIPMTHPAKLWASAGERVTCEEGHHICTVAENIWDGGSRQGRFTAWCFGDEPRLCPPCQCGAIWIRYNEVDDRADYHFGSGWR